MHFVKSGAQKLISLELMIKHLITTDMTEFMTVDTSKCYASIEYYQKELEVIF